LAITALVAACSSAPAAPLRTAPAQSHTPIGRAPAGPATEVLSYPARVGGYRLVDKHDKPVATATKDVKFPRSFSFASSARDGYYLPGHQVHQDVYLIAGELAAGVTPQAALGDYLGEFQGQEVNLTAEPAGPLGGVVKCWVAGGVTFCMWADNGTFGVLDYEPPFGLDTVLIHHLAGLVPRFRRALERPKQ
jgi:hypothetical protein